MIVRGTDDAIVPVAAAQRLAAEIPGSRLWLLPYNKVVSHFRSLF